MIPNGTRHAIQNQLARVVPPHNRYYLTRIRETEERVRFRIPKADGSTLVIDFGKANNSYYPETIPSTREEARAVTIIRANLSRSTGLASLVEAVGGFDGTYGSFIQIATLLWGWTIYQSATHEGMEWTFIFPINGELRTHHLVVADFQEWERHFFNTAHNIFRGRIIGHFYDAAQAPTLHQLIIEPMGW